jgi:hypothetical protein
MFVEFSNVLKINHSVNRTYIKHIKNEEMFM